MSPVGVSWSESAACVAMSTKPPCWAAVARISRCGSQLYSSIRPVMPAGSEVWPRWTGHARCGVADRYAICGAGEPGGGEAWLQMRMPAASIVAEPDFFQTGVDEQPGGADHLAASLEGQ
jgi:hypothetical protein